MPSNIKNRTIPKYTTQTNSHKGYTIEELRRLFGEGKQITSENLTELINQCFNYELVSGEGIRIIELKNNNFKNNTTKTYKIECTCNSGEGSGSGSGSGHGNVKADYGVRFGQDDIPIIADKDTIVANLYDYEKSGNIAQEGVYPVTLSDTGKLIVDMSTSSLNATVTAKNSSGGYAKNTLLKFSNSDSVDHFKFNVSISGTKVQVTGIRTVVDGVESTSYTDVINDLNSGVKTSVTWHIPCSCRVKEDSPETNITRTAHIYVDYTIKNVQQTQKHDSATTKFVHAIYFGYTCAYKGTAPEEKNPSIPSAETNQPCFKVYTSNASLKPDGRRTGINVSTDKNNNYLVTIHNTENGFDYILGYFNKYSSEQSGTYTSAAIVDGGSSFTLALPGTDGDKLFSYVILSPSGFPNSGEFKSIQTHLDSVSEQETLGTFIKEYVTITDNTYMINGVPLTLNYVAYTKAQPTYLSILNYTKFVCRYVAQ